MGIKAPELLDGYEIRAFKFKLYPTEAELEALENLQADLKYVWNWLVGNLIETPNESAVKWAEREGLLDPRPVRPTEDDYHGLTSEESEKLAEHYRSQMKTWWTNTKSVLKKNEGICPSRGKLADWMAYYEVRHDYQMLSSVVTWGREKSGREGKMPNSAALQGLYYTYKKSFVKGRPPPRAKRRQDPMPIRIRTGQCFSVGDYGDRGATRNHPERGRKFYNCQLALEGMKIRGRFNPKELAPGNISLAHLSQYRNKGEVPGGLYEGVSLVKEADGWWASVRVEVPKRVTNPPEPGHSIGLDVGLVEMVAASKPIFGTQYSIGNSRDGAYSDRLARLQQEISHLEGVAKQAKMRQLARVQQSQARHIRHQIYSKVLPALAEFEVIGVERLPGNIGQRGSRKQSAMKMVINMAKSRYGERVREVEPAFTSQTCSQCGERDKLAWSFSYDRGPICTCPYCGHTEHRDINAARNIEAKALKTADT